MQNHENNNRMSNQSFTSEPPIHILSSVVTIALDALWSTIEIGATASVVGIPALPFIILATGITCFLSVNLTQHFVARDEWGASIAKGFAMGIIAGVPYPFTGTTAGGILLGWAGLHQIEMQVRKLLISRNKDR
jgi:hypothetical protein